MKFRASSHHTHHGMNLVPLIDVLLILLIFFIVTFSMARFETELEISVPAADSSKTIERKKGEMVINIRQDGSIVWNSKVLSEAQLTTQLTEIARFNRKQAVIIRGDEDTRYRKIVEVLNATHRAGLYHVSFASVKAKAPGS